MIPNKRLLIFCLLLLCTLAVGTAAAGRSVSLAVDSNSVTNVGGQLITFNWNIAFDTTCTSANLQIIGPSPSTTVVLTQNIPCGASPIAGLFSWNVPLGQAPGVYTARLTFNSHWNGDTNCCARDFVDKAEVQFSVCCVSQVQFCKFLDVNGNGVKDIGDSALGGWTFTVRASTPGCATQGAVIATGVTDPLTGCATLAVPMNPCDALSTNFCVYETPPTGDTRQWLRTTPSPGPYATSFPITVPACQNMTVNVGNWCPGKLTFCKFLDVSGNGTRDVSDPSLGGWTFTVRTATVNCATQGTVVATGITDPVTGCTPELLVPVDPLVGTQNYCIYETPPAGDTKPWIRTTPSAGLASTPFQIAATGCQSTTFQVGDWCPGQVQLCKFLDVTGNGVKDPSDPPLSGWTFTVRAATTDCATQGAIIATGVTGTSGCTPVLTVPVDPITGQQNYCVTEAPPAGDTRPWLRTTPNPGPFTTAFPITVQGCGSGPLLVNVGDWCPGKVQLCKFLDLTGNGIKDPSDPPLSGWTFTVRTATTNCATQGTVVTTGVTDTNGCTPLLTVPVDPVTGDQNFCVYEAPPLGDTRPWLRTTPNAGPFATPFSITVEGCEEDPLLVNVGNWCPGKVKFCKFLDLNGSGTQEPADPVLGGWTFTVRASTANCATLGAVIATGITDPVTGCTSELIVPVDQVAGTQNYCVTEAPPLGDLRPWLRTTPNAGPFATAFPITVEGCGAPTLTVTVGNWVPVIITGFKFEDLALWPWTSPHYVGPQGQQNEPAQEPVPDCLTGTIPVQIDPDTGLPSPGIEGVTIGLFDAAGVVPLLPSVLTDATGKFVFGPFHFDSVAPLTVTLKELDVPADPSDCLPNTIDPVPDPPQPYPWPGEFEPTVAQSIWPCPTQNFTTPTELQLDLPVPEVAGKEYGFNYFYNRQPGRLWGQICPETVELQNSSSPPLPSRLIGIDKIVDSVAQPFPNPNTAWDAADGLYVVPELPQEPTPANNNRHGTFRLTPAAPSNPDEFTWTYRVFCAGGGDVPNFTPLPSEGYVDVEVPPGRDVRVDFCLVQAPNKRRCYSPVTITQQGWVTLSDANTPGIPGGMLYPKFPIVFANFTFFGTPYKNQVVIGSKSLNLSFTGSTMGITRLKAFLQQSTGTPTKLNQSYVNPSAVPGTGGTLAGELLALELNIAYNQMRQMPRPAGFGYNLHLFTLTQGLFKGKTVGQVRDIACAVLGGAQPSQYGLPSPAAAGIAELVDILSKINANYQMDNIDMYTDRGYLLPDPAELPFGSTAHAPPIPPSIP